jgi:hypothetical protein
MSALLQEDEDDQDGDDDRMIDDCLLLCGWRASPCPGRDHRCCRKVKMTAEMARMATTAR